MSIMKAVLLAAGLALAAASAHAARTPSAPASPIERIDLGPGTVSAPKANFRTEPDTKSKVIQQLRRGAKLQVIEKTKDGQWVKVKVGDKTGYVFAKFVKLG